MALFTRTGPDRFNILIRFYDLNIGLRGTLYEPPAWTDGAPGTTGRRQEGRKWQIQPSLMYRCLNTKHISACSNLCCSSTCLYHPPPPRLLSCHNSNEKTWPWSRQCKSNRGEIDGSNDSGLVLRGDSCLRQLRAIGLEIDESEDTALNFPSFSRLRWYPANTFPSSGFRLLTADVGARAWESWLMNVMIQTLLCRLVVILKAEVK